MNYLTNSKITNAFKQRNKFEFEINEVIYRMKRSVSYIHIYKNSFTLFLTV